MQQTASAGSNSQKLAKAVEKILMSLFVNNQDVPYLTIIFGTFPGLFDNQFVKFFRKYNEL